MVALSSVILMQENVPDLPRSDALAAALAVYLLLGLVLGGICVYLYRRNLRRRDPS